MEENFTNQPTQPDQSFDVPASPQSAEGIILLEDAQYYLITAGKWARFLGVMGFIGTAIMVIMILFIGTFMTALFSFSPLGKAMAPMRLMTVVYIPGAVVYFFASLYLYRFGSKVRDGVELGSSAAVTDGLGNLKSLFKLLAITTIVGLVLYALIAIGFMLFMSAMTHRPSF
jgi:cell division protein FtsX